MRERFRRRPLLYTLLIGLVLAAGGASAEYARQRRAAAAPITPAMVAPHLAERLAADSLTGALHPGVHDVYAARAGQPVWFAPIDRDAALDLLTRADRDALPPDSALGPLRARSDTAAVPITLADVDLALTDALLRFGDALGRPRVDATDLYGVNWTAAPPEPPDAAARLAEALAAAPSPAAALALWADGLRPAHPGYHRLRAALARELDLQERPELVLDRDLALGDSGSAVVHLRERLALDGPPASTDASAMFDAALAEALREVQRTHTLPVTGRLDGPTRAMLNVRQPELITLLALNLERWRWLPSDLGDLHLWVNVPRFELALRERVGVEWRDATRFVTVVGAQGWETPAFSDTLETIVFNPTWVVPASIQRESYGEVRGFVERAPGPGNAMGRVKFLFPNDHAVYVHDTPSKWAFGIDDRARSHGCVRAGDPEALARAILTRTNGWAVGQVRDIFQGPWWPTQTVQVEARVPVHIVYFTAEVDLHGRLRVFDDVYRRDARLADALGMERPDPRGTALSTLIADSIGEEVEETEEEPTESEALEAPADSVAPTLPAALSVPGDTALFTLGTTARQRAIARALALSDTADTTGAQVLSGLERR